ncbi:MAG: RNA methyltransferase, partial [Chitinophagaceae bacterium]
MKKYRDQQQRFTAEGFKVISELLHAGFKADVIYETEPLFSGVKGVAAEHVSFADLSKITA